MIRLLILDADGTLFKDKSYCMSMTDIIKPISDLEWTAIKCFKSRNVKVCILSGDLTNKRLFENRKIDFYYSGQEDGSLRKELLLPMLKEKYDIQDNNEILFVGDDVFDIPLMKILNNSFCPFNSSLHVRRFLDSRYYEAMTGNELPETLSFEDEELLSHNDLILNRHGGDGIVEELYIKLFGFMTDEDIEKVIQLDADERKG